MTILTPWSDTLTTAIDYLRGIDPIMADIIEQVGPCMLVPDPNIYEALVDAIVSQQISVKAADAIVARIRAATPAGLITPEALIQFDHDQFRSLGLSTSKARYIRDLTERVVGGELDLAQLEHLDDEAVIDKLTEVKGIGRWTAEMILIFCLGRVDILPVDDLGFVKSVQEFYGFEARPTRKEMIAHGEQWKPYRTIATWYMWGIRDKDRKKTRIISL